MFSRSSIRNLIRTYRTSAIPKGQRPSPKDSPSDPKELARRHAQVKAFNRRSPKLHPLYMNIPTALKYLRAAEVGQPALKTTISLMINVIPEKGSIPLQGSIFYPNSFKKNRVIAFTNNEEEINNLKINNDVLVGGVELINQILNDEINLDQYTQAYANESISKNLNQIARKLGPRGLMPTTKRGTVGSDILQLINENNSALPFKQKGRHVSVPIGRCDFSDEQLLTNLKYASKAIFDSQPKGTKKPNTIGIAYLSSTLGPSIVVDIKN